MRRASWFWALVLLTSTSSLGIYWFTNWPLGIPSEWTWGRFDITPDLLANALTCAMVGVAYLFVVAWGYRRLSRRECSVAESIAWPLALMLMAGVWIGTVQGTGATGPTVGRWPLILYYPSSSGYFFKARFESPHARDLLRNYESLMAEGDVLHVGTHPPGLFLFFHGLMGLVEHVPGLAFVINLTQPETVREAFDVILKNQLMTLQAGDSPIMPLTDNDRAVLWLAALISFGLCAATVWPIYAFTRQYADRPTSWLTAAVWPLIPAISMFLPKSDVAFAFPAMFLGWIWLLTWRRQSIGLACLAGAVWSGAILCSLAFLPVALWLAILSLAESWPALRQNQIREESRRALHTIVPAGIVCLGLLTALSLWGEIPLWKTFWLNYRNHAGFYAQYPRNYLAWLAVNPLELAGALGAPLWIAAIGGIGSKLFSRRDDVFRGWVAPCLATTAVWLWLWISGKNSGEAARLWIFLMPYFTVSAASLWECRPEDLATNRMSRSALIWLICQMLVCFWTVQRINGFAL